VDGGKKRTQKSPRAETGYSRLLSLANIFQQLQFSVKKSKFWQKKNQF
jgi:hypothetical protein